MIVRDEQWQAFIESQHPGIAQRIAVRMLSKFPAECSRVDDIVKVVGQTIVLGISYGLRREKELTNFVELAATNHWSIDPSANPKWISEFLNEQTISDSYGQPMLPSDP